MQKPVELGRSIVSEPNTRMELGDYPRTLSRQQNGSNVLRTRDLFVANLRWDRYMSKNLTVAIPLLQSAADKEYAKAQYALGMLHKGEERGAPQDWAKSIHYLTLSAEQDLPCAVSVLATAYGDGEGVTIDLDKAIELGLKAAPLGFAIAAFNVAGFILRKKQAVHPSVLILTRLAPDAGLPDAQEKLQELGPIIKSCNEGGKRNVPLLKCSGCHAVHYCAKECQKAAWMKGHKRDCKEASALREDIERWPALTVQY